MYSVTYNSCNNNVDRHKNDVDVDSRKKKKQTIIFKNIAMQRNAFGMLDEEKKVCIRYEIYNCVTSIQYNFFKTLGKSSNQFQT